jgi:hypothetical protein
VQRNWKIVEGKGEECQLSSSAGTLPRIWHNFELQFIFNSPPSVKKTKIYWLTYKKIMFGGEGANFNVNYITDI